MPMITHMDIVTDTTIITMTTHMVILIAATFISAKALPVSR